MVGQGIGQGNGGSGIAGQGISGQGIGTVTVTLTDSLGVWRENWKLSHFSFA